MNNEKNLQDEIMDQVIKRTDTLEKKVEELDKREVEVPDHTQEFRDQAKLIKGAVQSFNTAAAELKEGVKKHNLEYPATQIQYQLDMVHDNIKQLPKELPVRHHFDTRSKGFIISATVLLITVAICVGLTAHLWSANNKLEANDIKYRMVKQTYPEIAGAADSLYSKDPDAVKSQVIGQEDRAQDLADKQVLAKEKKEEAKEAEKAVDQLSGKPKRRKK